MPHQVEGLALPEGVRRGLPCCGVVAVAAAAGVPFHVAWDYLGRGKRGNWKGRTTQDERFAVLGELGVELSEVHLGRRATLNSVAGLLKPGNRYIVRTTGHVQIVKDGYVLDQRGVRPIAGTRLGRKYVTAVHRIVGD